MDKTTEQELAYQRGYNEGFKDGLRWDTPTPINRSPNYCLSCGMDISRMTNHVCNGGKPYWSSPVTC